MFTRTIDCTLKPEKKQEFIDILRNEVFPFYKKQAGFVDLVTMISDEHPNHAFVIAVWKERSQADYFYSKNAPLVDTLKPFLTRQEVEHFFVETSTAFPTAAGKAA